MIGVPFSHLLSTQSSPIYSLFHLHFHHSVFSWLQALSFYVYLCVLSSSTTHHSPFRIRLTSLCIILNLGTAPTLVRFTSCDFKQARIPSFFVLFFDFPPIAGAVDRNNPKAIMARSEDCLHCADLQAELEEFRAQQCILENQQRILETRIDDQNRVINKKYRAEIDLYLHRVTSLHEKFNHLSNWCSHAEESVAILQYIMDKKNQTAPSSSSAIQIEPDQNLKESTARQISHIEID